MARWTPKAFFTNWNDPRWTLSEKIRLAAKNNAIKIKNRSTCCGNHGEPGC